MRYEIETQIILYEDYPAARSHNGTHNGKMYPIDVLICRCNYEPYVMVSELMRIERSNKLFKQNFGLPGATLDPRWSIVVLIIIDVTWINND